MFSRPQETYNIKSQVVDGILRDAANPLHQIATMIPENSKVLDIGAGNGLLGRLFKEKKKKIILDGIEPNSYASNISKVYYRHFFNGFLSSFQEQYRDEKYDYIVLADVIEHIVEPVEFIREIEQMMDKNTKIIFSIPNIAFGSIRINLLYGAFTYTNSGILEKTHLRFYTYSSISQLMQTSGLNIEKIFYLHRDIFQTEKSPYIDQIPFNTLCSILSDEYSSVYQFLILVNKNNRELPVHINILQNKRNCLFRILNYKTRLLFLNIKRVLKKVLNEYKS